MPMGFVIDPFGKISNLRNFGEWKKTLLQSFVIEPKENITVEDHFEQETTEAESTVQLHFQSDRELSKTTGDPSEKPEQVEEVYREKVFQWWAAETDGVISESYRFDHCCARDLAAQELDPQAPFRLFPSIESTTQHHRNAPGLKQALLAIQERYKEDMGVGIIIIGIMEDLNSELNPSAGTYQVYNIIIIRQSRRPVLINLMWRECPTNLAKQFSTVCASRLKRLCLLSYHELCYRNTYLCFELQVYRIGKGFEPLQENVPYPQEYLIPNPATIEIVRYTLAGILLSCEPLVDRFGNIMVRHLSACQARFMLEKTSKVTLVEGKAGSGKSVLALETMRRIKRQQGDRANILFLCRDRGLASFIKYQTDRMNIFIEVTNVSTESMEGLNEEFFSHYTDIFIDDAHAIPLTGTPSYRAMYTFLFLSLRKQNSCVYIFPKCKTIVADPQTAQT